MRDHSHRDRLLKLPYSMGCATESSVAVGKKYQPKKQQKQQYPAKHVPLPPPTRKIEEKERWSIVKMRNIKSFKRFPNFGMGKAMNKMIKSFKRFPQLFVYKEEDEEEEEEEEKEMEIGLPTDVKHVTHIGWDGSTTINNPMTGWENLQATEILSLSSITLRQFELAMNAQTGNESSCVSGTKMAQKIIS